MRHYSVKSNDHRYQHCIWPEEFVFPPRVGDLIKAQGGRIAKIHSIIHTTYIPYEENKSRPMVILEIGGIV